MQVSNSFVPSSRGAIVSYMHDRGEWCIYLPPKISSLEERQPIGSQDHVTDAHYPTMKTVERSVCLVLSILGKIDNTNLMA